MYFNRKKPEGGLITFTHIYSRQEPQKASWKVVKLPFKLSMLTHSDKILYFFFYYIFPVMIMMSMRTQNDMISSITKSPSHIAAISTQRIHSNGVKTQCNGCHWCWQCHCCTPAIWGPAPKLLCSRWGCVAAWLRTGCAGCGSPSLCLQAQEEKKLSAHTYSNVTTQAKVMWVS